MQYKIRLSEIPFFNFVNPSFAKDLVKTFIVQKAEDGEIILNYGETVPGFYLIAEGQVDVYARHTDIRINSLNVGSTFGEMSLLEDETASATVKSVGNTVLLLCRNHLFHKLLADNFVFAAAFYKGAAKIVSSRLRETNIKIEAEMDRGRTVIQNMTNEEHGIIAKIGHTRYSINDTGESMIGKLTDLLPKMDQLAEEIQDPEKSSAIKEMKNTIKNVLLIDSQNFDIISQQMDQINQHMNNIQRLMSGLDISEVKGDEKIFEVDVTHARNEEDEDAITFF